MTTLLTPTDAEVISNSLEQPEAFGALFDRHFATVFRYLKRRVGDDRGGELAAETFARAFAARDRYVAQTPDARAWLLGIAENLVRGAHRSESRRLRAYARSYVASGVEIAADAVARLDAQKQAAAAVDRIRRLPRRQREVLLLHAWGELSADEIGSALGIPVGTVRSHLSRARATVADALAERPPADVETTPGGAT